jgi:hypothetical protein
MANQRNTSFDGSFSKGLFDRREAIPTISEQLTAQPVAKPLCTVAKYSH